MSARVERLMLELAALLPRLEGGEASRELDCELWSLETGVPLEWQGTTLVAGEHGVIGWCDPGERQRNFSTNRSASGPGSIPAYTTSLDAALALAERVLPGQLEGLFREAADSTYLYLDACPDFRRRLITSVLVAIVKAKIGGVG